MSEVKHTNEQVHAHGNRLWTDGTKDRGDLAHCRLQTGTHIPVGQNEANAARLALCWNSHDALVEALRNADAALSGLAASELSIDHDHNRTSERLKVRASVYANLDSIRSAIARAEKGGE